MTGLMMQPCPKRHYLFFGFMADDATLAKAFASEESPQISAIKFQRSLLHGLVENGATVDLLASLPIRAFPHNRLSLVGQKHFQFCNAAVLGTLLPSINLPVVRYALRPFLCLAYGWRLFGSSGRPSAILVYALHTPHLLAAIVLSRVFRTPLAVFVPDLPHFMRGPEGGPLYASLKALESRFLRRLIRSAVVFPIAEGISSTWLPAATKRIVVEGIAPVGVRPDPARVAQGNRREPGR